MDAWMMLEFHMPAHREIFRSTSCPNQDHKASKKRDHSCESKGAAGLTGFWVTGQAATWDLFGTYHRGSMMQAEVVIEEGAQYSRPPSSTPHRPVG